MLRCLVLLVLAALVLGQNKGIPCPKVFDGLSGGDVASTSETTRFGAHWDVLPREVLLVEAAIVSAERAPAIVASPNSCYESVPFSGLPDVIGWTTVRKGNSMVEWSDLDILPERNYYIVLRITTAEGGAAYASSNGFRVSQVAEQPIRVDMSNTKTSTRKRAVDADIASTNPDEATCAIDSNNRCRQAKERVGDQLNNLYGPPEWRNVLDPFRSLEEEYLFLHSVTGYLDPSIDTPTPVIRTWQDLRDAVNSGELVPYIKNEHDDDESSSASQAIPGGYAAILVCGIMVLLLLLLLLLAAALFAWLGRGKENEKWAEPVERREAEAPEAAAAEKPAEEGPDNTRVEFPDIDPGARLSVAPN